MNGNLSKLVGMKVQISRSDGRVHSSTVKSVDENKSTVMVEWLERNACRGKEVEVSDLFSLNSGLFELVKSFTNKISETAETPADILETRYEGRLRSSRIPALSASATLASPMVQESVSTRSRQTCLFQASGPVQAPGSSVMSSSGNPETVQSDFDPSSLPTSSALSNRQRRENGTRAGPSLPSSVHDARKESEAELMPPPPLAKGRRKSMAAQEMNKSNKRLSNVKSFDLTNKKGKFSEASRPNQKFFEMIQDYRETLEICPLSTTDLTEPQKICVCVRKRPLNRLENTKKEIDVVSVPGNGTLLVHEPKHKVDLTKYLDNQVFHFDYSFDENSTNELVYKFSAQPLVKSIFEGGMATCFAYGQTGSGKTHTMGGGFTGRHQNSATGIYAFAAQDVFTYLTHRKYAHLDLSVYVSFFEIYNGKVYDLLNKKAKLRVLEDDRQQVQVVGLEEVCVSTAEDVIKMLQIGSACRTSGQTSANANSSRSHAVLQIGLRRNDRAATLYGKFSLVDLAGNERGTDVSSNDRSTLVETAEINRSLLALKECIRSLGRNSDHIPFRMSTLTKVLRDSFIGEKSKTCMIAMVSPGMASCEYTMNTLRYADRVKELNGNSKTTGALKEKEEINSSSEEESVGNTSVLDVISEVTELEEKVYTELKRASQLAEKMDQITFNIEEGLPDLMTYSQKLMDTLLELQSKMAQERKARMKH
ncbi:kinesin-like protein KIF2C [Nematolebias whitei]|uniref:kinesin-like protein KIF2C n=1 Tax=Nematolebias whitei TaxID=451745 RepID=UPI00189993C3|nr:kinesin-like protein KIF2C [Nematolebias whitei]